MHPFAKFRESLDEEKLRRAHQRLWSWVRMSICCTIPLFAAAVLCDALELRYGTVFLRLGSLASCLTFALVILLSLTDAVAATILTRQRRFFAILGAWVFNGFLIALSG